MKTQCFTAPAQLKSTTRAFTLVELLVVIGIIGVILSLTLPALVGVNRRAKIATARTQITVLQQSIQEYQIAYNGRFPVSTNADNTTIQGQSAGALDFTFGTVGQGGKGVLTGRNNQPLTLIENTVDHPTFGYARYDYQANNSEVMAILLDQENFTASPGGPTVNFQHRYNLRKKLFNPGPRSEATKPGIGDDLVYRDPWGNPYIITMALKGDGQATDAFYRMAHVSEPPAPDSEGQSGLVGLSRKGTAPWRAPATSHPGDRHGYYVNSSVAIWSFGPDGKANFNLSNSPDQKAGEGDNKDNILSWK